MTHGLTQEQPKKPSRRRPTPTHAIKGLDTKVVSLVDKPANGVPFVFVKAEGDPPPVPAASGETAAEPATDEAPVSVAMAMPTEAKSKLSAAVKSACAQLEKVGSSIDGATEDDSAAVPVEPLREIASAAMMLAEAVRPFAPTASAVTKAEWTQEYEDTLEDYAFLYVIPGQTANWRTQPLTNRKLPVRDHTGQPYLPGIEAAEEMLISGEQPWLPQGERMQAIRRLINVRASMATDVFGVPGKETDAAQGLAALAALAQKASALVGGATAAPEAPTEEPAAAATTEQPVQQSSAAPGAEVGAEIVKAIGKFEEVLKSIHGAVVGGQKPAGDSAEALQKSLADKDAELADLRKKTDELTQALQKAKRAAPPSNQGPGDASNSSVQGPVRRPASGDMTEVWAEEERRAAAVRAR